jgi:NAD-dependent deacetylase
MLAELIEDGQPCIVLTGAGISTESGIPDFRSREGLWAQYDPYEVASIAGFRANPERAWEFYAHRLAVLAQAEPNAAHLALAELERRGLVRAVITQNVDGLHRLAGSSELLEVHGSIASASCPACGRTEPRDVVESLLPLPRCADCGTVLKPDVVMFGELLPKGAMEGAVALVLRARLLVVVGSSLEVYPVAGLVDDALRTGTRVAIVNRGATAYDDIADLKVDASAGETLADVVFHVQATDRRQ